MKENEVVREMTFEEEAVLYEKAAKELFAKETPGEEAPPINHLIRRGMRIIRKARKEKERMHGRWWNPKTPKRYGGGLMCSVCNKTADWTYNYCPNCGCRMDKDGE